MRVALCWVVSFLCSMYGVRYLILGNLGLLIGIYSIYYAGKLIRDYNRQAEVKTHFMQAWWMALLIYFFATLCTTFAQFIYFRFIDNGMMAQTMNETLKQMMEIPQYKELLNGASKQDIKQAIAAMGNPTQVTYMFFISNTMLGLILSLPTALIGNFRTNNK